MFPCRVFLSCVADEIFVKVPQFQENFPSLTNYWLLTCTMAYLRVTLRFINSLVVHFKENHENAKCIDFQFHNFKFSQKATLDFHVTAATDICMKEIIDSCLRRKL